MLPALLIAQIQLEPVEPPAISTTPRSNPESEIPGDSSPVSDGFPRFQGSDYLNHLLDTLRSMGFRPVRSDNIEAGSPAWRVDMSARGYRVEEHREENVREIVRSMDMETGKVELIGTDPMDVTLIIVRDGSGKIVDAYLIRRIKHHYRTGETRETTIVERFIRKRK